MDIANLGEHPFAFVEWMPKLAKRDEIICHRKCTHPIRFSFHDTSSSLEELDNSFLSNTLELNHAACVSPDVGFWIDSNPFNPKRVNLPFLSKLK